MIPNIYKGDYRLLLIFPLILIALSIYYLPGLKMGVDFRGGTLITLHLTNQPDAASLQSELLANGFDANVKMYDSEMGRVAEVEVSQTDQMVRAEALKKEFADQLDKVAFLEAEANTNSSKELEYVAERANLDVMADEMFALGGLNTEARMYDNLNRLQDKFNEAYMRVNDIQTAQVMEIVDNYAQYSSKSATTVSPALSTHFLENAGRVVIMSALLSVALVFFFFRAVVPSIAVLTGAACDIIIAMGAMAFFGIPLTLPSFAALLMLIGFSLDTDVLLTTRLVKRRGDPRENAWDAMKTGMTMSFSAMVAFLVLFAVSMITHIAVYYEISAVALAGLVGDVFATWGLNAVMVLYYKEHMKGGGA